MSNFKKFKEQLPSKEKFYSLLAGKKISDKEFRNNSIKNYGHYLSHHLSAPALSWDAILNTTKVKLEVISYPDMYIFFEKGMRGGVSYISNRYSKANNKYLKSYDPKQESKHIIHLDAKNLYGRAKEFDLSKYTSNSSEGCVLEMDLE